MTAPRERSHSTRPGRRIHHTARHVPRPRFESLEERCLLSTVDWISISSGDWDNPSNWSTGKVPGPSNDVVINVSGASPTITIDSGTQSVNSLTAADPLVISGGSLTLAADSEIDGSFTYSDSGTLTTDGTLTLKGATTWSAGTFAGTGTIDNASGATLTISGSVSLTGTLNNDGTIDQTAGTLNVYAAPSRPTNPTALTTLSSTATS